MQERNTKQKELILNVLKDNRVHPTIYEIYKLVKCRDSKIGQATVYRNIKKFVQSKQIIQLNTKNGIARYDYYHDHVHLECLDCGKIVDVTNQNLLKILSKNIMAYSNTIVDYSIMLEGYCEECQNKKREVE